MKNNKKLSVSRLVVLTVAIILAACTAIGGTVAWLIAKTEPVVNTFTYGDINITLEETDTNLDGDNDPTTNQYEMIPGNAIKKDPKVTVKAESENAWLFVKLEKSQNFDEFLTYQVILDDPATTDAVEGWTALDGVDGVYYKKVDKANADAEHFVLVEDADKNTVFVKDTVTKEMLNALDANGADNYPKLTITAYAVQRDEDMAAIDTAAEAWALVTSNI